MVGNRTKTFRSRWLSAEELLAEVVRYLEQVDDSQVQESVGINVT